MDYSTKVTIDNLPDQRQNSEGHTDATSSSSSVGQSDGSYSCPVCPIVLTTSRDLSNHLRGHNLSPRSTDNSGNEEGFSCNICGKILSSASSLARHLLVHTGARPFKCNNCPMAFTTNGNMNRHLRTAHREVSPQQIYTDSEGGSSDSDRSTTVKRRHVEEYNNNEVTKRHSPDIISDEQLQLQKSCVKKRKRSDYNDDDDDDDNDDDDDDNNDNDTNMKSRKYKIMLNNSRNDIRNIHMENNDGKLVCPVCGINDLHNEVMMDIHLQQKHPDYTPHCDLCDQKFQNYRCLVIHQYLTHHSSDNSSINGKNMKNSVVGFPDLTFMDFSADKFPAIARAVCEQSIHRPATGESAAFQCTKCSRAFPCRSALDSHELDCGNNPLNYTTTIQAINKNRDDNDDKSFQRDHFFAGLDLQNKTALTEAKEGKDLADIQSIISVTSGPIFPRSDASTPDHQIRLNSSIISSGSSGTASSEFHADEEPQDPCAGDFRKMKAKGEFPCRLCSAIFPNLRALKGHNRAHTNVPTGMPYPCNMCSFSSTDKQTLTRHLRHHNGDRPFICGLCGYQFTTKANCERHVKNRHGRLTKEDVKNALIQKPCDDYVDDTNENNSSRIVRDDVRKSLIYPNERDDYRFHQNSNHRHRQHQTNNHYQVYAMDTTRQHEISMSEVAPRYPDIISPLLNNPSVNLFNHRNLLLRNNGDSSIDTINRNVTDDLENQNNLSITRQSDNNSQLNDNDSRSSDDDSVSLVNEKNQSDALHQRVQSSPIDLLQQNTVVNNDNNSNINDNSNNNNDDAPLDLSMDVLDLSKKSHNNKSNHSLSSSNDNFERINNNNNNINNNINNNNNNNNNNKNNNDFYSATNKLLLTQALLNASQSASGSNGANTASLEALYAANAQLLYGNFGGFSNTSGILPTYMFSQHLYNQEYAMRERLQKELVRGLQLTSGGTLVEPPVLNNRQSTNVNYPTNYSTSHDIPSQIINEQQQQQQQHHQQQQHQHHHHNSHQRDYPQRITANVGNVTVAPTPSTSRELIDNSVLSTNSSQKLVIKNGILVPKQKQRRYRTERPFNCGHCSAKFTLRSNMERHVKQQHPKLYIHKSRGGHSTRGRPPANPPTLLPNLHDSTSSLQHSYKNNHSNSESNNGNNNSVISDQVKYAILAQQLKGKRNDDNDTDEELIIDEGGSHVASGNKVDKDNDNESSSLLRGKLEENINNESTLAINQLSPSHIDDKVSVDDNKINNSIKIKAEPHDPEDIQNDNDDCDDDDDDDGDNKDNGDANDDTNKNSKDNEKTKAAANIKNEDGNVDLASVSELLDNASQQYQQFQPPYMSDEEGLVASNSDCNNSGSDEKSDSINSGNSGHSSTSQLKKKRKKMKKSAYSMAPNRVICPYCQRPFPWTSSLRRHILTHTGQKPYQCVHCLLLFTTKSNCDRHLLRKHKTNSTKIRRRRNTSSPEVQEASTKSNDNINNNNNNNINNNNSNNNNLTFLMRNVPERPYKCNKCPSSTFSTLGNLKKHRSTKHFLSDDKLSSPESPTNELHLDQHNSPASNVKQQNNEQSDCESPSSSVSEMMDSSIQANTTAVTVTATLNSAPSTSTNGVSGKPRSRRPSPRSSPGPSDAPFKCHLCDSSFAERHDCLNHIKVHHKFCYKMLVAKGALKMDTENVDDPPVPQQHHSDGDERRGKFPDYSSRKVVCAFCMRRFWSAEDLRRHMRTHSGERPFKCDVCKREFTLKHSMLRHRKKHESESNSTICGGTSGEEESTRVQSPTIITPRSQQQQMIFTSAINRTERNSLPTMATVATGDAAPSGLMRFNPYENLATMTGQLSQSNHDSNQTDNDNDLISNLLGIRDRSIIDRVLQASADDAAKLLGVNRSHD